MGNLPTSAVGKTFLEPWTPNGRQVNLTNKTSLSSRIYLVVMKKYPSHNVSSIEIFNNAVLLSIEKGATSNSVCIVRQNSFFSYQFLELLPSYLFSAWPKSLAIKTKPIKGRSARETDCLIGCHTARVWRQLDIPSVAVLRRLQVFRVMCLFTSLSLSLTRAKAETDNV